MVHDQAAKMQAKILGIGVSPKPNMGALPHEIMILEAWHPTCPMAVLGLKGPVGGVGGGV